jgi:uncharacterized protein (TIGR02246 family)
MRIVLACLLAATVATSHAQQSTAGAGDEAAVRDVVGRYVSARDARDPSAVEALFTPDADQFNTAGEWRRGRDQIRTGTAESSQRNPGTRRITVESVRFATPDVAIVDGPYEIAAPGAGPPRRMWTTLVVVRTPQGWRISAIRNMAPTTGR